MGRIKCIVWDLDNTLWSGTLSEDPEVVLKPEVPFVLSTLDGRGILHSIASRNHYGSALAALRRFGIADYFLYPQINWEPKSSSLARILERLNIGADAVAFVDDDPYERDEVRFSLPGILCLDGQAVHSVVDLPETANPSPTAESRNRRSLYRAEARRREAEDAFAGPKEEFLATLAMVFTIGSAREEDLRRAEELTNRTHQLNTTGVAYTQAQLLRFLGSPDHDLVLGRLEDRYGAYGTVGLALLEKRPALWRIKLFLMSCRVMTRGLGSALLHHIRQEARRCGVRLEAEMVENDRNRMMYAALKFSHFAETGRVGNGVLLENDLAETPLFPAYLKIVADPIRPVAPA